MESIANLALPSTADPSLIGMFVQADPVVKGVMVLLVIASVACWAVIFDRTARLIRLRRHVARFETAVRAGVAHLPARADAGLAGIIGVGLNEARERADDETRGEARARCERAMRSELAVRLRALEPGLPLLATVGSTAPFIGLFGTVWGIMNSFAAIARANDTSLAVVAPGIAEALFATALGLAAAIPAVIAYNKLTTELGRIGQRMAAAIAALAGQMIRTAGNRTTGAAGAAE